MTARWDIDISEAQFKKSLIRYAARPENCSTAASQSKEKSYVALTSPAAFANMCLLSGQNDFETAFGGIYGLLLMVAGPQNVKFMETDLLKMGLRLQKVEVSTLKDLYFGPEGPYPKNSNPKALDLSKSYIKWVRDPDEHFNQLHNRRVLVQLGIILCALGKDMNKEEYCYRWLTHWLGAFCTSYGIETPILPEMVPLQPTLEKMYTFFATRKDFRAELVSLILKYANKKRVHPFTILCGTVARILKFAEMEHLVLIIEHIGGALRNPDMQYFITSALYQNCGHFLMFFNEMEHRIPNYDTNLKYAMLLHPDLVQGFVRHKDYLSLAFVALTLAKNPKDTAVLKHKQFLEVALSHEMLTGEKRLVFLKEVLMHYTDISCLYESLHEGFKRKRRDLTFTYTEFRDSGRTPSAINEWLVLCATDKTDKTNVNREK